MLKQRNMHIEKTKAYTLTSLKDEFSDLEALIVNETFFVKNNTKLIFNRYSLLLEKSTCLLREISSQIFTSVDLEQVYKKDTPDDFKAYLNAVSNLKNFVIMDIVIKPSMPSILCSLERWTYIAKSAYQQNDFFSASCITYAINSVLIYVKKVETKLSKTTQAIIEYMSTLFSKQNNLFTKQLKQYNNDHSVIPTLSSLVAMLVALEVDAEHPLCEENKQKMSEYITIFKKMQSSFKIIPNPTSLILLKGSPEPEDSINQLYKNLPEKGKIKNIASKINNFFKSLYNDQDKYYIHIHTLKNLYENLNVYINQITNSKKDIDKAEHAALKEIQRKITFESNSYQESLNYLEIFTQLFSFKEPVAKLLTEIKLTLKKLTELTEMTDDLSKRFTKNATIVTSDIQEPIMQLQTLYKMETPPTSAYLDSAPQSPIYSSRYSRSSSTTINRSANLDDSEESFEKGKLPACSVSDPLIKIQHSDNKFKHIQTKLGSNRNVEFQRPHSTSKSKSYRRKSHIYTPHLEQKNENSPSTLLHSNIINVKQEKEEKPSLPESPPPFLRHTKKPFSSDDIKRNSLPDSRKKDKIESKGKSSRNGFFTRTESVNLNSSFQVNESKTGFKKEF